MAGMQVDGCFADPTQYNITYPDLGLALNKTGRAMVYSCSWPAYLPDPVMTSYQVCSLPSLSDVAKLVSALPYSWWGLRTHSSAPCEESCRLTELTCPGCEFDSSDFLCADALQ